MVAVLKFPQQLRKRTPMKSQVFVKRNLIHLSAITAIVSFSFELISSNNLVGSKKIQSNEISSPRPSHERKRTWMNDKPLMHSQKHAAHMTVNNITSTRPPHWQRLQTFKTFVQRVPRHSPSEEVLKNVYFIFVFIFLNFQCHSITFSWCFRSRSPKLVFLGGASHLLVYPINVSSIDKIRSYYDEMSLKLMVFFGGSVLIQSSRDCSTRAAICFLQMLQFDVRSQGPLWIYCGYKSTRRSQMYAFSCGGTFSPSSI